MTARGRKGLDEIGLLVDAQAQAAGFRRPMREHKFCDSRRWRCDFFWPEALHVVGRQSDSMDDLALEIEGGVWTGGRHTRGAGFLKDCEKYNTMAAMGIRLIRLTPQQVRRGELQAWLEKMR